MELSAFATTILRGTTWADKLVASDEDFEDRRPLPPLTTIPPFPGRPQKLSRFGRSVFPDSDQLTDDVARGRLLHFFANHELLAMELMALTLLKFPDADPGFRRGLARTIVEEQKHLRMYVERMQELGVDFGELPVSDYFWKALKDGRSPLEFVVQMSLTLEQANLDFSLFYQRAVATVGDAKTADILEMVYREEIGHVKHGLKWFHRWREPDEDDWDGYLRLLPLPMNPRRAKGPIYCGDARRAAGFSERYIREMEVYSGSKGRPACYWIFNPFCEAEIAQGRAGVQGSAKARGLVQDLETVPAFLALESDVVFVEELPRARWLKSLQEAGIRLPEFRKRRQGEEFPERHLAGVEPWGWSPGAFELFRGAASKLITIEGGNGHWSRSVLQKGSFEKTALGPLFSKEWSVNFYRRWIDEHPEDVPIFGPGIELGETIGRVFRNLDAVREYVEGKLARSQSVLAKAPWGTSGRMNRRIADRAEWDGPSGKWIEKILEEQGSIVLEPWLEKVADLSVQIEVREKSKVLGARQFLTGSRLQYRGTVLGPGFTRLTSELNRFLHSGNAGATPLVRWQAMAEAIGTALYAEGYEGNAGVDALLAKSGDQLFFRPIVEVNPRWTMGRVALQLERYVVPKTPAVWLFIPASEKTARDLARRHPVRRQSKSGRDWISEGIVFTTDPEPAREVFTMLAVGAQAIQAVTETLESNPLRL